MQLGSYAVLSWNSLLADLRVFCANFRGTKMRLCYFLRYLHVWPRRVWKISFTLVSSFFGRLRHGVSDMEAIFEVMVFHEILPLQRQCERDHGWSKTLGIPWTLPSSGQGNQFMLVLHLMSLLLQLLPPPHRHQSLYFPNFMEGIKSCFCWVGMI